MRDAHDGAASGRRSRRPFLLQIPAGDAADLQARLSGRSFDPGDRIIDQRLGDDTVAVLLSGHAKTTARTADGREVELGVCRPGDLLGELAPLDRRARDAGAVAVDPCEVGFIAGRELRAFLLERPGVALVALRHLAERLREADQCRVELSGGDSLGRVAAQLLELGERYGHETEIGVQLELPVTQDVLAGWTGAGPETVARALRLMRRLGWVSVSRREITVHDLEALRRRRISDG